MPAIKLMIANVPYTLIVLFVGVIVLLRTTSENWKEIDLEVDLRQVISFHLHAIGTEEN